MKRYYIFTMAIAFLLGGTGITLWLIFNINAGAVLVCLALLTGGIASFMRPTNRWLGILDIITNRLKKGDK